jgi:hypothetical protein
MYGKTSFPQGLQLGIVAISNHNHIVKLYYE